MLINLLPDFFSILDSTDPIAAYKRYFTTHHQILNSYWHNYVLDPNSPHFTDIIRSTVLADRSDLRSMLQQIDVVSLAQDAEAQTATLLESDVDVDVVLMVGVGAANAGELVTRGKGLAFVCLEHFTGKVNTETQGLGLDPELIPLWLAHEITHTVRYTSPISRSILRHIINTSGGNYSFWETGRHAPLCELLINEGLATEVARVVSPGHADWEYFGYARRQFTRIREMEPILTRAIAPDLDHAGLGLRLRYLSSGLSSEARTVDHYVLPERSGYYIGARLVQPAIAAHGYAWTVRASADEIIAVATAAAVSA